VAFDELHDQVRRGSRFLNTYVVKGDKRRMTELADNASFPKKAIAGFAAGEFGGEQLYRERAVNERVITADDAAVGACADSFKDLVAADLHGERAPQCAGNAGGESSGSRIKAKEA
jgi:hypothetical protein